MTKFNVGDKGHCRGVSYFGKDLAGILLQVFSTSASTGEKYMRVKEVHGKGKYIILKSSFIVTEPVKPTKNQRITALEEKVKYLQSVVDSLTHKKWTEDDLNEIEAQVLTK